jgi:TonB family protein
VVATQEKSSFRQDAETSTLQACAPQSAVERPKFLQARVFVSSGMNSALLYRPPQRWRTWLAFAFAALIHVAAVGLAKNKSETIMPEVALPSDVTGIDTVVEVPPQQQQENPMPPPIPPPDEEQTFPEDNATPPLNRNRRAVRPIAHPPAIGPAHFDSVRVLVLYGPRPDYPYVARRDRVKGSGVALAIVNPATGDVLHVQMAQSTGNVILDNSTVSTLRRWRFRPGTPSPVKVPITYTLSGASY